MSLQKFINSKLEEDTPIGDLARDIMRDKEFQSIQTDEEKLSYLSFVTNEIKEVYEEFLNEFNLS